MSPGVEGYVASLKNLKDSVNWISVEYDPPLEVSEVDSLTNLIRIETHRSYSGHLQRFTDLLDKLTTMENGWYIFTDTADVRFQAPIPNLKSVDKPIIAVSEGILHKEHSWWTGMIEEYPEFRPLLDEPVHNMGVVAMRGYMFLTFLNYLRNVNSAGRYAHNCDQALYNLFLLEWKDEVAYHPSLMTCLFDNWSKGNVLKKDGLFVNREGEPYSIVHANGNHKNLLEC
jgi:hypothetical protein